MIEDEKIKRVVARQQESFAMLAETQAPQAIAEAVFAIVGTGRTLTLDSLLAELLIPVKGPLLQHRNETARKALLATWSKPSSPKPE